MLWGLFPSTWSLVGEIQLCRLARFLICFNDGKMNSALHFYLCKIKQRLRYGKTINAFFERFFIIVKYGDAPR